MRKVQLQGWELAGFWPYVPLLGNSMELGQSLKGVTDWIPAQVPGCVHHDLLQAGLIQDPYWEMNSLCCEWVSNRWWMYRCVLSPEKPLPGQICELVLEGIDYSAHLYLNGVLLERHTGMYRPAVVDVTSVMHWEKENILMVLLEHAPDEMGQIGYTELTSTQKARFGYKWDFGTRLVHLGLYGEVFLRYRGRCNLEDVSITSDFVRGEGIVVFEWRTKAVENEEASLRLLLLDEEHTVFESKETLLLESGENHIQRSIVISNPECWFPNGHGKQPLYSLHASVMDAFGNETSRTFRVGVRSLSYIRCEGAGDDALPYQPLVNGNRIYLKGVNLVPLDMMYGAILEEKYREIVRLMHEANVNLVRVWGGGLVEKKLFFDLCDEAGIMVWQEFIQSSSGISNVPSTNDVFLELLEKTATEIVREKRNHVCLTFWSGGNELMEADGVPVTFENQNIRLLANIVKKMDPTRLMLPTSASGPIEFLDVASPGKNHDVHGPWKYGGVSEHYHTFNQSDSMLHSEFGVDGMGNLKTLETFLSEAHLVVTDMASDLVWRHHGEWWDTLERDSAIFGSFGSLSEFIECSQFIQAEGIRYALESNRRRAYRNCGSILWQFNEPWPNVSCTSVVDWFNQPKRAYEALKLAYRPACASMRYDKLVWQPGECFVGQIFVHNEGEAFSGTLRCVVKKSDESGISQFSCAENIGGDCCMKVLSIHCEIPLDTEWIAVDIDLQKEEEHLYSRYLFPVMRENGCCPKSVVNASVCPVYSV